MDLHLKRALQSRVGRSHPGTGLTRVPLNLSSDPFLFRPRPTCKGTTISLLRHIDITDVDTIGLVGARIILKKGKHHVIMRQRSSPVHLRIHHDRSARSFVDIDLSCRRSIPMILGSSAVKPLHGGVKVHSTEHFDSLCRHPVINPVCSMRLSIGLSSRTSSEDMHVDCDQ
jgi:hypothetical protein